MKPAQLDLLRRRQRQAVEALAKATAAKRGDIGRARGACIRLTAELLRATLATSRPAAQPPRPAEPDLFQQIGT